MAVVSIRVGWFLGVTAFLLACCASSFSQDGAGSGSGGPASADEIVLREFLILGPLPPSGRVPIPIDEIQYLRAGGQWHTPAAGDKLTLPDGKTLHWELRKAGDDGWLNDDALNSGYALATVESRAERVMLLDASGHSVVYVNGTPRAGDPYRNGLLVLPILLKAGPNELLFACGRGGVRAKLSPPSGEFLLSPRDATQPELIVNEPVRTQLALPVLNATAAWQPGVVLLGKSDVTGLQFGELPPMPPLSVQKQPVPIVGQAIAAPMEVRYAAAVQRGLRNEDVMKLPGSDTPPSADAGDWTDTLMLRLSVQDSHAAHRQTFVSSVDDSVQYFAVQPKVGGWTKGNAPALVVSLHGAGVEAMNQAGSYAAKDWAFIVAPTNRRPFGFDWEDIGRLDMLEVINEAQRLYCTDPQRVLLTGHSMGGHGAWNNGVTLPGRFAAIAPSAGWISFASYAGAPLPEGDGLRERILRAAAGSSDTLAMLENLKQLGVYVLHGDADDNVPVEQAREMRKQLGAFHADFAYYERPGAGHWWGSACVDWPPLMDFLRSHRRRTAGDVRQIDFVTMNPAVSASCDWVLIEQQERPLRRSRVSISLDAGKREFTATTENVARLTIELGLLSAEPGPDGEATAQTQPALAGGSKVAVVVDGARVETNWPGEAARAAVSLEKSGGAWRLAEAKADLQKSWRRNGPFKQVFNHEFVLVAGTHGNDAENQWALEKARFDGETFYYRGNGAAWVITDDELMQPSGALSITAVQRLQRCSVVLYGNAESNSAWSTFLPDCPVEVSRGAARIGTHEWKGEQLGALFIRPRPGTADALVGVIGGTGIEGMRAVERLPIFLSGVGYPDCLLIDSQCLRSGVDGIVAAGIFENDWSVGEDFFWR